MNQEEQTAVPFATVLEPSLLDRLRASSKETGRSIRFITERAIRSLLDSEAKDSSEAKEKA